MGIIKEYKCSSCRKTWKLFTGHGMKHSTLNHILDIFPADLQVEILKDEDVSGEFDSLFDFNYRPAICHQCQDIVAVPVLHFIESGHTYIAQCPECGNTVEFLEEDADTFCPKCLKHRLSSQEAGHWD